MIVQIHDNNAHNEKKQKKQKICYITMQKILYSYIKKCVFRIMFILIYYAPHLVVCNLIPVL